MLPTKKNTLTPERLRFIRQLAWMNFGQIHHLAVRHGQPTFTDTTRCVHEFKPAGDNEPRPALHAPMANLTTQFLDVFALFDDLQDAVIDLIEVKAGQPFRVFVPREPRL